jgi:hypothetical protein
MPKPRDVLLATFARIKRAPIPIGLVLKPDPNVNVNPGSNVHVNSGGAACGPD